MDRYGVMGWPVAHSKSPVMHKAAFAATGIDADYDLIPCPPEAFDARIPQLVSEGYRGWNCTVPHKNAILKHLDEIDPEARLAGSVNTVKVLPDGRLSGFSTDGYGLRMALQEELGFSCDGASILFVGAGGAASAVALHFALAGAARISIANRSLDKAEAICAAIVASGANCRSQALSPHSLTRDLVGEHDLVIQCTSLGLKPDDPMPMDPGLLAPYQLVCDMIYGLTPFRRAATALGCATCDGRGMLLHQGARAWEIWTGQPAPLEVMREALKKALG